jgi:nucleoporin NUP82
MDNWASILRGHPIFKPSGVDEKSFNLSSLDTALPSTSGLQDHDLEDALPPKRKAVVVRDNDVVVAVGTELRVASVESGASKAYTVRHTLLNLDAAS